MSLDLRTVLNLANSQTGYQSDGASPAVNNTVGQSYQGGVSIDGQHTNSEEATWTTSIGGPVNLIDATIYFLVKDNLLDTFANGGVQALLVEGNERVGYFMGGNDAVGISLPLFFNGYKLDVSVIVPAPLPNHVYQGVEVLLDQTIVTGVGVGTVHLAKAVGNVANIFKDAMRFHQNDSYALRINGGTALTPTTMASVVTDDIANGTGLNSNPSGSQYNFFGPTEWGEPAGGGDTYFEASDETWTLIGDNSGGHAVGAGHFPFRVTGNATDVTSFSLLRVGITNVGTRGQWDLSSTDVDTLSLVGGSFTDTGDVTFAPQDTGNKEVRAWQFNNCGQVYFSTIDASNCVFNGADSPLGAVLWDESSNPANQSGFTFNSPGAGHAVHVNLTGNGPEVGGAFSFDIAGWAVNGYETVDDGTTGNTVFLVDNDLNNDVTINVVGGSGVFSYERAAGYTGTVNIVQVASVRYTFIDADTNTPIQDVRVVAGTAEGLSDIIAPATRSDSQGQVTVAFSGATPQTVFGRATKGSESPTYMAVTLNGGVITAAGLDTTIPMSRDD